MKYEQKVQVETQEYICLVKRIDGVVAQKQLVSELIRCKDCKWWKAEKEECAEWYDSPYAPADGYCFRAERRKDE